MSALASATGFLSSYVVQILGLGVIGLSFLLALMAYRLLVQVVGEHKPTPPEEVKVVYCYMAFSLALCVIGMASQFMDRRGEIAAVKREREDDANIFQAKISSLEMKNRELGAQLDAKKRSTKILGKISGDITNGIINVHTIKCYGTAVKPPTGVHLWLAVEIDGHWWPKDNELTVNPDGTWKFTIIHGGESENFAIVLLGTDDAGDQDLKNWIQSGNATGNYIDRKFSEDIRVLCRIDSRELTRMPGQDLHSTLDPGLPSVRK